MSMIDFYGGEMLGGEMLGGVAEGDSWMEHVAKVKENNPTKTYKQVLQMASKSYKSKAKKGKKTAKKQVRKVVKKSADGTRYVPKKTKVEALLKAIVKAPKKGKKERSMPSKQKAIDNAMYLRERLFPVANSKNKKMKITMEHLKKMGFNTKAMTKAEKVALSKHLSSKLSGRGIGQNVGAVVDDIFGFGVGQDVGSVVDDIFGFGIGQNVGAVVDDIFGFGGMAMGGYPLGRHPVPRHRMAKHPVRHKRGGFNLADLAPLAMLL
jgi:hypothetical protein